MDLVSDCLNQITMYEKLGKKKVLLKNTNTVFMNLLKKLKELDYVKEYSVTKTVKGNIILVDLDSKINAIRSIKPRLSVGLSDFDKFEKRYLPARNFGYLLVSTNQGILTHEEAKKKGIGGVLLAYVY